MRKQIIIIIFIIILIIIANTVSQFYIKNFFDSISEDLNKIEDKLISNNSETSELEKEIENIENKWNSKHDYFACFIEHDELEKVETQLISISANIKVNDYGKSVDEVEKCKFIIKHIKEKDSLKIVNIF